MKTSLKLSAYGAALALIVTGAYAVGTAVGPLSTATSVTPSIAVISSVTDMTQCAQVMPLTV